MPTISEPNRCPDCSALLGANASACECGWRAMPQRAGAFLTSQVSRDFSPPPPSLPPLSRERMQQRIDELKAILKRAPDKPGARARPEGGYMREVTREHGRLCMCEICFPVRMAGRRYRRAAESGAETPRTNGFVQRMRRHKAPEHMTLDELRVYCDTLLEEFVEFAQQLEREIAA